MTGLNSPVECSSFGVHSESPAISVSNPICDHTRGGAYVPIEILSQIPAFKVGVCIPNLDGNCDLTGFTVFAMT
jgi:hypothetical protein